MSDVFQTLLPQGSTVPMTSAGSLNGKAGLGDVVGGSAAPNSEMAPITFKIALQNTISSDKVLANTLLPGALPQYMTGKESGQVENGAVILGGELLPTLPPEGGLIDLFSGSELTAGAEEALFLFSAPIDPSSTPLNEPAAFVNVRESGHAPSQGLTISFRAVPHEGSATTPITNEFALEILAAKGDSEPLVPALLAGKLTTTTQKEFTKVGGQSLPSLIESQNSSAGVSQSLAGMLKPTDSVRVPAGPAFTEILNNIDGEFHAKSADTLSSFTVARNSTEPVSSSSFTFQSVSDSSTAEHMKLSIRFGQAGWAEQLTERAANLAGQNIKQAEVQLNPQEMGPIHIKISVSQEQAAVTFAAQNAQVREAIDQSLSRLREAFESNGLELVQADVQDQRSGNDESGEGESLVDHSGRIDEAEEDENRPVVIDAVRSGIDHFV